MLSVYNPLYELFRWTDAVRPPAEGPRDHALAVDVVEGQDAYELIAEVPGVRPEDLDVKLEEGVLTISGKRDDSHHEERNGYRRIERRYGKFCRSFSLPEGIHDEAVSADLKDGVLTVRVPKGEKSRPRKIEVKNGAAQLGAAAG